MKEVLPVLVVAAVLNVLIAAVAERAWNKAEEHCLEAAYLCADSISYFESFELRGSSAEEFQSFKRGEHDATNH